VPIRPEMAGRYSADWPAVRERIQNRARNRCEWCGVPNRRWVFRMKSDRRQWQASLTREASLRARAVCQLACYWGNQRCPDLTSPIEVVCTTAHVHDRSPENVDEANLAFLCQLCHLRHDAKDKADGVRRRREQARGVRRLPFENPVSEEEQ
jgi:hypothetical protein